MDADTTRILTDAARPLQGRLPPGKSAGPIATHTGIVLQTLLSPASAGDVANVATWQSGRHIFRTSSGQDEGAECPVPFAQPRSCQGAVLPGARYTICTASAPLRNPIRMNECRTYVWWARLEALPAMTEDYAKQMLDAAFLNPNLAKRVVQASFANRSSSRVTFQADGPIARGQLSAAKRAMKRLEDSIGVERAWALDLTSLYWRVWACPLLFRLWPQRTLRTLDWQSFVKLAELVTHAQHPTPFMFRWVLGDSFPVPLPSLDVTDILVWQACRSTSTTSTGAQLQTQAQPAWRWPTTVPESVHAHLLPVLHVLQRTFKQTVHTYVTPTQVAEAYFDGIGNAHLSHDLKDVLKASATPGPATYTPRTLPDWLSGMLEAVESLGVIVCREQPTIEIVRKFWCNMSKTYKREEAWGTISIPILYPRYLYEQEQETVTHVNNLVERFDRTIQADGCHTEADVRAKIAAGQAPTMPVTAGAPRWDSPQFQAKWATCDPSQQAAVVASVLYPLIIVDGRPGYGKTHVGEVLSVLFPCDEGLTLALAAYGRIAALLERRLGAGFTFHKAAAMARSPTTPPAVRRMICGALTCICDELSLHTLQHWSLVLPNMKHLSRLVLLGDIQQMPGIGAGTVIGSLVNRYRDTPAYVRLLHPHRFLPREQALAVDTRGLTERPASPFEGAAVVWNMQELDKFHADPDHYQPDLLYGTSWADIEAGARFVILPRAETWEETLRPVAEHYFVEETQVAQAHTTARAVKMARALPPQSRLQILAHRREFGSKMTRTLRELVYPKEKAHSAHFYLGECIAFSKNKYFSKRGKKYGDTEAVFREPMTPAMLANVVGSPAASNPDNPNNPNNVDADDDNNNDNMDLVESQSQREDEGEGEADAPPDVVPATSDAPEFSDRSWNVMNGQVRRLVAIVDVASRSTTSSSRSSRSSSSSSSSSSTPARQDKRERAEDEPVPERPTKRARTESRAPSETSGLVQKIMAQKRTGVRLAPGAQSRLLVFADKTQLNVTRDYDMRDIRSAAVTTVNQAQGDEREDVHFLHELFTRARGGQVASQHVTRELVHTAHTRAQRTFVWHGTLDEFLAAHRGKAPMRQERFAFLLDYEPVHLDRPESAPVSS